MDSNMKNEILIIGAGQLGSRHLQGVLKCDLNQNIYVLDPSPDSLKVAAQRANEINHNHDVYFVENWNDLPENFDLVIVATNADIREKVITRLINNHEVKYLILEKVLFQEIDSYHRIGDLLNKKKVPAWVNHPRRMFKTYKNIKALLNTVTPKIIQVTGGNWGLGCNALHFIDLFTYLTDAQVKTLDTDWIETEILPSKRNGFIEFTGTIKGTLTDNSIFQITSLKGDPSPVTITVFDTDMRIIIQESGTPKVYCLTKENKYNSEISPFEMEFQSSLTTMLANDLFESNTCDLPDYDFASVTHLSFITAMLNKHNSINNSEHTIIPVT